MRNLWKRTKAIVTMYSRINRIDLSTGGFVEVVCEDQPGSAYIRIHLGKPKHSHDLDETYKYVRNGSDKEIKRLVRELRFTLQDLEGSL